MDTTPDVARLNWRADLLEYSAAAFAEHGFDSQSAENAAKADVARKEAAVLVELAAAKATFRASERTAVDQAVYTAAKQAVRAARQATRLTGPPRPGIVDNFIEPTDAELKDLGY